MSSPTTTPLIPVFGRLFWMIVGPMALVMTTYFIVTSGNGWTTTADLLLLHHPRRHDSRKMAGVSRRLSRDFNRRACNRCRSSSLHFDGRDCRTSSVGDRQHSGELRLAQIDCGELCCKPSGYTMA